jgi:hypothetical protein
VKAHEESVLEVEKRIAVTSDLKVRLERRCVCVCMCACVCV